MRVLVTGGAGFIGSALCRTLAETDGWEVVNIDKLTYAADLRSLAGLEGRPGYRFVKGDICDRALLDRVFEEVRPHAVLHLAAESHVDRSIDGAAPFIAANIVGSYTLLEAALAFWDRAGPPEREAFRFIHVSTDEVFGSLGPEGMFSETSPYDPRSPYSASKAAADHLARAWGHTYGLPVIVTNATNNYGPYQFPEKLIPLMILSALEGAELPVYGDGGHVRDWLHVQDHVSALITILRSGQPGASYGVGGRSERTNLEVVGAICDLVDELAPRTGPPRRSLIRFVADRPGHDRRYAMDTTRLETELGWRPAHNFPTGLRETVSWYLANRDWWAPIRGARYSGGRLGLRAGDCS